MLNNTCFDVNKKLFSAGCCVHLFHFDQSTSGVQYASKWQADKKIFLIGWQGND